MSARRAVCRSPNRRLSAERLFKYSSRNAATAWRTSEVDSLASTLRYSRSSRSLSCSVFPRAPRSRSDSPWRLKNDCAMEPNGVSGGWRCASFAMAATRTASVAAAAITPCCLTKELTASRSSHTRCRSGFEVSTSSTSTSSRVRPSPARTPTSLSTLVMWNPAERSPLSVFPSASAVCSTPRNVGPRSRFMTASAARALSRARSPTTPPASRKCCHSRSREASPGRRIKCRQMCSSALHPTESPPVNCFSIRSWNFSAKWTILSIGSRISSCAKLSSHCSSRSMNALTGLATNPRFARKRSAMLTSFLCSPRGEGADLTRWGPFPTGAVLLRVFLLTGVNMDHSFSCGSLSSATESPTCPDPSPPLSRSTLPVLQTEPSLASRSLTQCTLRTPAGGAGTRSLAPGGSGGLPGPPEPGGGGGGGGGAGGPPLPGGG
eukprot:Hpha_TRINITY_DN2084_c0_g1::TRINITY_DN2084_c0_g1_i1::g.82834::m.82834